MSEQTERQRETRDIIMDLATSASIKDRADARKMVAALQRDLEQARDAFGVIRKYGVCPDAEACVPPRPESDDCAGCIKAWEAMDAALASSVTPGEQ